MINSLAVSLLSVCLPIIVNGLSFHMGETEKKCFIEDLPEDTLLTGNII